MPRLNILAHVAFRGPPINYSIRKKTVKRKPQVQPIERKTKKNPTYKSPINVCIPRVLHYHPQPRNGLPSHSRRIWGGVHHHTIRRRTSTPHLQSRPIHPTPHLPRIQSRPAHSRPQLLRASHLDERVVLCHHGSPSPRYGHDEYGMDRERACHASH
ncbi:hypothetical protein BJ165DRAFT_236715 [Panaeolus papilionaceus]|nr:hypothetical protein BJ165DRAFT_236715 [Panaeolus papilionaceus]